MTRTFQTWRRTLSGPAWLALDAATFAVLVLVLLPFVGWPDAAGWALVGIPALALESGLAWMARHDPA